MYNVICMKWGDAYNQHDVNVLYHMVKRNLTLPHRFVCFTDDATGLESDIEHFPLPEVRFPPERFREAWLKLGTMSRNLGDLEGTALFLDLDIVIVDKIDCFFEYPGEFCIIHNWTHPHRIVGNSSVYRFQVGAHAEILDRYHEGPEQVKVQYRNEQTFLSHQLGAERLTYWPDTWCISFKRHCMPHWSLARFREAKLRKGAKIVVFHGNPKPAAAIRGEWKGRFKRMRKTPWIADYWY